MTAGASEAGTSVAPTEVAWFIMIYALDNGSPAIHRFHIEAVGAKSLSGEAVVHLAGAGLPQKPDGDVGLLSFDSERECKAEYDRLKSSLAAVGIRWTKSRR